ACIVQLEELGHISGINFIVLGDIPTEFSLMWTVSPIKKGWKATAKLTENAAIAIAFLLVIELTEYTIIEEARVGTGIDYWLGYPESHELYDEDNFLNARLEVSGIRKMSSAKELHRIAMESLQKADEALLKRDIDLYKESINKALESEAGAAMLLKDKVSAEPTRSVLFRSSASIAISCGKYEYAEWLIIQALRGNPPSEIKNELISLSDGIFFKSEAASIGKRVFDI
nr:hypothetical protein [Tanacetum cinerariifolium]